MVERSDPQAISIVPHSFSQGYLSPFSDARVAVGFVLATVLTLIVFNRFPQLDILVSNWFFHPSECPEGHARAVCGRFQAAFDPTLAILRDVFQYTPVVIGLVLLGAALAGGRASDARLRLFAKGAWTSIAALLLSGLLLVNMILKEFSGRPRPVDTDLFGGSHPFVEAGRFVNYCQSNCSFVSGEAATAFWVVCLVPLVPRQMRPLALAIAIAFAVFASGLRIAFGGHYLSDAAIAGLLTLTVFSVTATLCRRAGWYETGS